MIVNFITVAYSKQITTSAASLNELHVCYCMPIAIAIEAKCSGVAALPAMAHENIFGVT